MDENEVKTLIYLLNGGYQRPRQRSYESLSSTNYYNVSKLEIRESEYGIRVAVFFNGSTEFIYLPPRLSRKFIDNASDFEVIRKRAFRGKMQFRFSDWDSDGQARFYFKEAEDGETEGESANDVEAEVKSTGTQETHFDD